jgi:hypothetical protein
MGKIGHAATAWLLLGGLGLTLLMGYTLIADFPRRLNPPADTIRVAVFYPNPDSWLDFRQAADLCVQRGLAEIVDKSYDSLTLRARGRSASVLFTWHDARGLTEISLEVRRLAEQPHPPVAVIGSSNTVLTAVLAQALASLPNETSPVLLVPDATAVRVALPGGSEPVDLLAIHRGRSFRLGLDNRRQAELALRHVFDRHVSETPRRVFLAIDRDDPYSQDLATAFLQELARLSPGSPAPGDGDVLDLTGRAETPGSQERLWVTRVWQAVEPGQKVMVFLPLQSEPARRLLVALEGYAPAEPRNDGSSPLVICGDGLGRESLAQLAGPLSFPVWSTSSASIAVSEYPGVPDQTDALIPAEAIVALMACLNPRDGDTVQMAEALRTLDLPADDPRALGRALAFDPQGERRGLGLGHVLGIEPESTSVFAHVLRSDGHWVNFVRRQADWREHAWREASWTPVASRP